MQCPFCHHRHTRVVDKRESADYKSTRRRRVCLKCHKRFTTYERVEYIDIQVVKKDGRREPFDRNKILKGIKLACEASDISDEKLGRLVDMMEARILRRKQPEISSEVIGEMIMKKLRAVDPVAYIRFASVCREFKDVKAFELELKQLRKDKR